MYNNDIELTLPQDLQVPVPLYYYMHVLAATPRLFFDPLVRSDGVFLVEVNRRASLACLVDGASYPPVTSMTITPSKTYKQCRTEYY